MSLRTEILDSLPDKITDPTLVHNLKHITNTYANDIRNLTNNSLFTQDSVLDENTEWNNLPLESYGLVLNWKGSHAPKLHGAGIVFVIGSGAENTAQIAISRTGIAIRNADTDWSIISNHTHLSHARLYNDVQKVLNEQGIGTLTDTVNSLVDTTSHYEGDLSSIYQNENALSASNKANASHISSLNGTVANDTSKANSMYGTMNSYVSSINTDVSSANTAINDRETHGEANDMFKHVQALLAQKWSFIDGDLPYSDLNLDTTKGAWRILAQPLQNAPSKYYNNFTDGLLQVQPVGDNNLFQMLYLTIGNADDTDDQNTNVDGNGALCYRFGHTINGNVNWLKWNTVPYQSDFDDLRKTESKDYTYLSSLENHNTTSLANYADGLYSIESETRSESAVSLADKGVSLYYDALHSATSYYQANSSQTDNDYNVLQNKIVSGESQIAADAAQSAENQAKVLANSIATSEAANGGKVSDMTKQMENLIGNVNNYRQEINDHNQIINTMINNAEETASKSASSAAQVATNDSSALNGQISGLSQGINGKLDQQNDKVAGKLSKFQTAIQGSVKGSLDTVNHTIQTDSGELSKKELSDVQFIEDYLGLDPSKNPHPQKLNIHGNDSDVSSLMSAVYGSSNVDSVSANSVAISKAYDSLISPISFNTVSTAAADTSGWVYSNGSDFSDDDTWIHDNSSVVSSAVSATSGVPNGTTLQQEINTVQPVRLSPETKVDFSAFPTNGLYYVMSPNFVDGPDANFTGCFVQCQVYYDDPGSDTYYRVVDYTNGNIYVKDTGAVPTNADKNGWIKVNSSDVKLPDMSQYVTQNDLSNDSYVTQNELPDMSSYVTNDDLSNDSYVTKDEIPAIPDMSNYVTNSDLSNDDYATESDLKSATSSILPFHDNTMNIGYGPFNYVKINDSHNAMQAGNGTLEDEALPAGLYMNNNLQFIDIPSYMSDVSNNDGLILLVCGNKNGNALLIDMDSHVVYVRANTFGTSNPWTKLSNNTSSTTPNIDLSDYVKSSDLTSTLGSYASTSEVSSINDSAQAIPTAYLGAVTSGTTFIGTSVDTGGGGTNVTLACNTDTAENQQNCVLDPANHEGVYSSDGTNAANDNGIYIYTVKAGSTLTLQDGRGNTIDSWGTDSDIQVSIKVTQCNALSSNVIDLLYVSSNEPNSTPFWLISDGGQIMNITSYHSD